MAEKSTVFDQKLKQKGIWSFSGLYEFCFGWLKGQGYDVKEKEYSEKITNFGKDITVEWEASKKITDYFRYILSVKWKIIGMGDVEVEQEGRKVSSNKGDLGISIKATLERDYEDKWENKPSWKFLRGVYDKYVVKTTLDEYEKRLIEESTEYFDQIKAFLKLGK